MPSKDIREWLIAEIAASRDAELATRAAARFGVTRQAVARHLKKLQDHGAITAKGRTRARRYELGVLESLQRMYPLSADFHEDVVWSRDVRPLLGAMTSNVLEIAEYGVTEMLNNARDHSGAGQVLLEVELTSAQLTLVVWDEGIGIFRKIKEAYALDDERHAILELVKGRLTTDPERHTGEGIFFTSRAFDAFTILSGPLSLVHTRQGADWLIDDARPVVGTYVRMKIDPGTRHTIREVFDHYATEQDDYAFRRTHLMVALAQTDGGSLISRSQAKRIMARCERFQEIVLDFKGVESIGPAFADEIFRVWRRAHPHVTLKPRDMTPDVERMVRRALAADTPDSPPGS